MPVALPQFLGRYELGPELGNGGAAAVYLARSRDDGKPVAIKVLHSHMRETATEDLLLEARLAGSIEHPNVVRVLEVSNEPAGAYLVMEYVDGETLSSLKRHPLPDAWQAQGVALRVLLDALQGLQAAHELRAENGEWLGLVHRDFTPQNVLVGRDGHAKLSDFGTAKASNAVQRTRTGQVKGKVAYMAPEQVRGLPLDRRCDLWAAGVMAWEILAGRPLHLDPDEVQIMFKVVTEAPPALRDVLPEVPAALDAVVGRALLLEPEARWGSATELHDALQRAWTEAYGPLPGADAVARAVSFARAERPTPPPSLTDFPATPVQAPRDRGRRTAMTAVLVVSALAGVVGLRYEISRPATPIAPMRAPLPGPQAQTVALTPTPVNTVSPPPTKVAPPATSPDVVTPPRREVRVEPRREIHLREAPQTLQIVANEPVTRLQVDQEWLPVTAPTRLLQIPIGALQAQHGLVLHAVNDRGQTLETRVAPGARSARLDFVSEPSELRPRPGLADNPYGDTP